MSKRWNQKGTFHAKQRMEELRLRKTQLRERDEKNALAIEWAKATGNDFTKYWEFAKAAGVQYGCGHAAICGWLRSATKAVQAA